MDSFKRIKGGVLAPKGFLGNAVGCGIKKTAGDRLDTAVIYSESPCVAAGTFTTNRVKAAPVRVTQAHMRADDIQAIIANSGNANACTGVRGIEDSRQTAKAVGKALGLRQRQVAVCSTGVIGLPMPMDLILPRLDELSSELRRSANTDIAKAIMTSDTHHKEIAVSFDIGGQRVKIGACAKGAGMICPSMATMLCFVTTDVAISKDNLERLTHAAVETSFNRITIDGDMSTNDTVIVLANGKSGVPKLRRNSKPYKDFAEALEYVMLKLARKLVRDGERVTKFVTVKVCGARTHRDAQRVAEAVANSALVKASWNGEDPNWGRIIHAVGYSGARIKEELIEIHIAGHPACVGGLSAPTDLEQIRRAVTAREFEVCINLNQGNAEYEVYTSDLSPEYIDFNRSEYAYWKNAREKQEKQDS